MNNIIKSICILSILLMIQIPAQAWSSSGTKIDTHDIIFQKAINMLPTREKGKININWTMAYNGLHAPDCLTTDYSYCIGDTDRPHHVYYFSNGDVQDDSEALSAKDEYQLALAYLSNGDMDNFSFRLGTMSHYLSDPGSFPHTMGSGTDWGDMNLSDHTAYESAVNRNSHIFDSVHSDGYKKISAYDATLKLAYEVTFDNLDGGIYTNVWMRDNFNRSDPWSVPHYEDRVKGTLNYNVNLLSDVMHTMIDSVYPDTTPSPTPIPKPPSIISSGPNSSSLEGETPSTMFFNITTDQKVNTTWYLDGDIIKKNYSANQDFYNDTINIIGLHKVNVTVKNQNGTDNKKWNWNIIGKFEITSDIGSVYVNKTKNVTFTVTRECGIEKGDNCSTTSYMSVPGVDISLKGNATGSNTTNEYGQAIISINATKNGTIIAMAHKSGYLDDNITIIADIYTPLPTPTPTPTPNPDSGGGSPGGSSGDSGGGSGGSGGSGGGSSSPEPYNNIYKYEIRDDTLSTDPVTLKYTTPELAIYEVTITGTQRDDATLRIEVLKNKSELVGVYTPGSIIYKNLNFWINSNKIKDILIRFKVENSWLSENNIKDKGMKFLKWDNSSKQWNDMSANMINKDDKFTYFESKVNSLSSFVISGNRYDIGNETPSASSVQTMTQEGINPEDTNQGVATGQGDAKSKTMMFEGILSLLIIISIIYISKMRDKK